jgi:HupE/UreJ protein
MASGELLVRQWIASRRRLKWLAGLDRLKCILIMAALAGAVAPRAAAHDIPADVRVTGFVKPAGDRLALLLRVPLAAMIEVDYPTRGPGYLDLARADQALRTAVKVYLTDNITVYENSVAVAPPHVAALKVSLPSDRSFVSYEAALVHVQGPRLADDLELYWNQQMLDVLLEYPIRSERSDFAIRARVDRFGMKVTTALRFLPPDGAVRAFEFQGDPGLIALDPSWHQAALRFVALGFHHILGGVDHLLFVFCLVVPFRRLRPLVIIVTAFTVAHSISLTAAAFGFVPEGLWFPPLIETLIAATILAMALENIVQAAAGSSAYRTVSRRWTIAFAFGLVHGFGFSFALRESFQFAGDHLVSALLAFNLGIELGQIAVLVVLVPALALLFRTVVAERVGIIILSAFVAHTAWHWTLERGQDLAKFPPPTLDAALLASAMRGMLAVLILAGIAALVNTWLKGRIDGTSLEPTKDLAEQPKKEPG